MAPNVALFACCIFVLFLLWVDAREGRKFSPALWIPLIWVLLILSKPLPLWLNPQLVGTGVGELEGYESGTSILRFTYSFLVAAGLLVLLGRRVSLWELVGNNKWLCLFFLYCLASVIWSDFPIVSFKRLFRGFGTIVMILVVLTEADQIGAIKTIGRRLTYFLIPLSIVLIKYYPQFGRIYETWGDVAMWVGVTSHKNGLGRLCLISAFFLAWEIFSEKNETPNLFSFSRYINLLFVLLIGWLFYKADSATSTISFFAGLTVFFAIKLTIVRNNIQFFFICSFFLLIIGSIILLLNLDYFIEETLEVIGHSDTFWGRTVLWERVLELSDNALFGCGYDSFWLGERLEKIWEYYWWKPNESHNGYIDLYLDLGLVGTMIWVFFIFSTLRRINNQLLVNFDLGRVQLSFLVIYLLYNITESAYKLKSPMCFIFLLLTITIPAAGVKKKVEGS